MMRTASCMPSGFRGPVLLTKEAGPFGTAFNWLGRQARSLGGGIKGWWNKAPVAKPSLTPLPTSGMVTGQQLAQHWPTLEPAIRDEWTRKLLAKYNPVQAQRHLAALNATLPKERVPGMFERAMGWGGGLGGMAMLTGGMMAAEPVFSAMRGPDRQAQQVQAAQGMGMHLAQAASLNDENAFHRIVSSPGMHPTVSQALTSMWGDRGARTALANQDTAANTIYQMHQHLQTNPQLTGDQLASVMGHQKLGAEKRAIHPLVQYMLEAGLLTGAGAGLGGVFGDEGGAMRGAGAGLGTALGTSAGATIGGALGGLGTYGVSRLAGNRSREALYHGLTGAGAGGLIGGVGGGVYGGIKGYQRVHGIQQKKKKREHEKQALHPLEHLTNNLFTIAAPFSGASEAGPGHRMEGALRELPPGFLADQLGNRAYTHVYNYLKAKPGMSSGKLIGGSIGAGLAGSLGGYYGGKGLVRLMAGKPSWADQPKLEKTSMEGVGTTLFPLFGALEAGKGHRTEGALRGILPGLGADIGGDLAGHYARKALLREGLSNRQHAMRALGAGLLGAGGSIGTAALGHGLTNLIAGEPSWHKHHKEKKGVYDHGRSASPAPTPHPAGTPGQMIGRPLPVKPPRPIGRPMQQPQMAAPNNVPKTAALRAFLS
jgi:hypothetical protein